MLSRFSTSRLTDELYAEYEGFDERDLSDYDVVYHFVDGVCEDVRTSRAMDSKALNSPHANGSGGSITIASLSRSVIFPRLNTKKRSTASGTHSLVAGSTNRFPKARGGSRGDTSQGDVCRR